jgi:hypothetical protein
VEALREYEGSLLTSYQHYLKALLAAVGEGSPPQVERIAVRCMCALLITHPHFNYT